RRKRVILCAMRVRVRVPASSANLGPGFDALGLALALYNEVEMEEAETVSVIVHGEGEGRLDGGRQNVVARGAAMAFEAAGRRGPVVRIRCVNRIPLGRGLGSSAAAWVGGLVGANALMNGPLDRDALVTLAARAEGHPDNVAAALLGGLTVSCASERGVVALSLPVPPDIAWVTLIPETESSTREARAVLPPSLSRAAAFFNFQRVILPVAPLPGGGAELVDLARDDRFPHPSRPRLFPWMRAVQDAARHAGALGCVLSGAGSTILAAVQG